VLIGVGGTGSFTDAALVTSGPFNVANDITVSGGGEATRQTTPYTLTLGGTTDNNSTFSGKVLLQNNLTVSQSATTGNHALNLTGGMFGVLASIGPNDTTIPAADNTGFQTVTFAGAGRVNVTGMIADIDPNPTNYLGLTFAGSGGVVSIVNTSGTTSLTGNNHYTGTTTIAGGTLILGKNAQAEVLTGPGGIVNAGLLALDYSGGGTNPSGTVNTILSGGFAGGFQSGQIRTTNAVDATKAIGWRDDSANSQVLIKYTWEGDANVDGVVNALDFNAVATNFGATGRVWAQGDFNYDGAVTTADFTMLAQNFLKAPLASAPPPSLGSLVPEPGMLSLVGVGAALAMRRRRR
jgi:autotransporter-associated beta strand protein